jgi:antitoxin component YwqK of YwqJK toxin-antitoxin module
MRPTLFAVIAVLPLCGTFTVFAQTDDGVGNLETETVVVGRNSELDDPQYDRAVKQYWEATGLDENHKLRLTIAPWWDPSKGIRRMIQTITPINSKGQPDGEEHTFRPLFGQSRSVTYQAGVRHGVEKEWAGSHSVRYLRIEIPWQNGKIHGQRKLYHPNGKVMTTTTYRNDVVTGESRTLDPEGRLERTVSFRNGKKHGEMKDLWPETGKLRRSITYRDGKVEGVAREYYSNGKLKRESPLKNNALHGIEKLFQPDGKPQETRYWIDGDLVDEKEFRERFKK